jgi:lipopolysaccharide transport system ATP-binding protein
MSEVVLTVDRVSKRFATYRSNLGRVAHWLGAADRPSAEYWAVRNISFKLHRGEAMALVGHNGAGKSTLLKLITGTTRPSNGAIAVNGRISAVLELGLGFNPEFTGRQNIYQAGGFLGYSRTEIDEFLPWIEQFAELGEYFDQPLRTYSSGMQARLAFSLATAKRPEILIVDEVLSVGDSYFQHKSFERIRAFRDDGVSILFVTHSMSTVRELCQRAVLLDHGLVLKDGAADEVVDYYNALVAAQEAKALTIEQRRHKDGWLYTRSGTFQARLTAMNLVDDETGEAVALARVGQRLRFDVAATADIDVPRLVLGCMIRDRLGHVVWGTNTWHTQQIVENVKAGETVRFSLRFPCVLGPGSYSLSPALVSTATHLQDNFDWVDNPIVFDVVNADRAFFIGSSWIDASFQVWS